MTVLETLLKSAARLCDAESLPCVYRAVYYGFPPAFLEYVKDLSPARNTGTGRALVEGYPRLPM